MFSMDPNSSFPAVNRNDRISPVKVSSKRKRTIFVFFSIIGGWVDQLAVARMSYKVWACVCCLSGEFNSSKSEFLRTDPRFLDGSAFWMKGNRFSSLSSTTGIAVQLHNHRNFSNQCTKSIDISIYLIQNIFSSLFFPPLSFLFQK